MTTRPIRIRRAVPQERERLATIAYAAKARWGYARETLDAWLPELSPSARSLVRQPSFVAEVASDVAGWCQIDLESHPIELAHFWVHPDFQRRGVGRALLEAVLAHLRPLDVTSLAIDADPNAEGFYLAAGAIRQGSRRAPIPGDPARVRPQLLLSIASRR
ncbi:MAG: GNAT family N-acetyltransferase [Lautropia sp.]